MRPTLEEWKSTKYRKEWKRKKRHKIKNLLQAAHCAALLDLSRDMPTPTAHQR
jgi:hypothetical protein